MDYLSIGPVPPDEDCEQVGPNCDYDKMKRECKRYIEALRKKLGPERGSARLSVKGFPHDFGTYYEVVCYYSDQEGLEYALDCESNGPLTWDAAEIANTSQLTCRCCKAATHWHTAKPCCGSCCPDKVAFIEDINPRST